MHPACKRLLYRIHTVPEFSLNHLGEMYGSPETLDAYEMLKYRGLLLEKDEVVVPSIQGYQLIAQQILQELSQSDKFVLKSIPRNKKGLGLQQARQNICGTPQTIQASLSHLVDKKVVQKSGGYFALTSLGRILYKMV